MKSRKGVGSPHRVLSGLSVGIIYFSKMAIFKSGTYILVPNRDILE